MSKFDNMLRHQHAIQKMLKAIYPEENKEDKTEEVQPLPEPPLSFRSRLLKMLPAAKEKIIAIATGNTFSKWFWQFIIPVILVVIGIYLTKWLTA